MSAKPRPNITGDNLASSTQSRNAVVLKAGWLCLYITEDHKIKVELGTSCRDCSSQCGAKATSWCRDFSLLHRIQSDSGVETRSIGGLFLPAARRRSVEMYFHHRSVYLHVLFNKKTRAIVLSQKQNSTPTFCKIILFVKCPNMFRP